MLSWRRALTACHRKRSACSRPRLSLAWQSPCHCCRPSLRRQRRACSAAGRISRPESSSMRHASFPSASTPSSTPSRTRWPTVAFCRSGGGRRTPGLSRSWRDSPAIRLVSRLSAWRITLCRGRCGTRPWHTADRRGRGSWLTRPTARPWGTSSRRSVPSNVSRRRVTHASRPSISASPSPRRSCALGPALLALGGSGRVLECLREADALAAALDDPPRLGQASVFLTVHFYLRGVYDQAIAAGQRALTLATAGGHAGLQAVANGYLGRTYESRGDYRRAIDYMRQTVASIDEAQHHERFGQVILPAVSSRAWLAVCHAEVGLFAEGALLGERRLPIAEVVAPPAPP